MSKYFTPSQLEAIVNELMSPSNNFDPLPGPLLEYDNFGKVLDSLVDTVIFDINYDPTDTLYRRNDLGKRYDRAEEEVLGELKKAGNTNDR